MFGMAMSCLVFIPSSGSEFLPLASITPREASVMARVAVSPPPTWETYVEF